MPVIELSIERLAHGGDGIAHDDEGRVVFVRGGCPGDTLLARLTHERPTFARALAIEVVEPSADRVEPRCPYAGACGGCQWQHVSYGAQLAAKRRALADALERIARIQDAPVKETVPCEKRFGYRNRIELTTPLEGILSLGFHGLDGEHVAVDTCDLIRGSQRDAPRRLSGALRYLQGAGSLGVARVGLRVSSRGETAVDVWTPPGPFPRAFAGSTLAKAIGAASVSRVLWRPEDDRREIRGVESLAGPIKWSESLAGFEFEVSPVSFFQVNTAQAQVLVRLVTEAVAATRSKTVLDAFCGVGTFTLPLAATGASVIAIEGSGSALRDLRDNLEAANLDALVLPGDVARALADVGRVDAAVVDPPRSGLGRGALEALVACEPSRLVYVSCDPATFARDSARLGERGYDLTSATPVDLFPQTFHVEVVGVFDRVPSST